VINYTWVQWEVILDLMRSKTILKVNPEAKLSESPITRATYYMFSDEVDHDALSDPHPFARISYFLRQSWPELGMHDPSLYVRREYFSFHGWPAIAGEDKSKMVRYEFFKVKEYKDSRIKKENDNWIHIRYYEATEWSDMDWASDEDRVVPLTRAFLESRGNVNKMNTGAVVMSTVMKMMIKISEESENIDDTRPKFVGYYRNMYWSDRVRDRLRFVLDLVNGKVNGYQLDQTIMGEHTDHPYFRLISRLSHLFRENQSIAKVSIFRLKDPILREACSRMLTPGLVKDFGAKLREARRLSPEIPENEKRKKKRKSSTMVVRIPQNAATMGVMLDEQQTGN